MRCPAAALGLLASAGGLTHQNLLVYPSALTAWLPGTLQTARRDGLSFSASRVIITSCTNCCCCSSAHAATAYVGWAEGSSAIHPGARRPSNRYRCCIETATYRRPSRLGARGEQPVPIDKYSTAEGEATPGAGASVAAAAAATAVIYELEMDGEVEDSSSRTLSVYGELHRLLGSSGSRRLLGPDTVATLTSKNYLVIHPRDRREWPGNASDPDGGGAESRLALGDRRWDVWGTERLGPTIDAVMRGARKEYERPPTTTSSLECAIESVVKICSKTEIFIMELQKHATGPTKDGQGEGKLRVTVNDIVRKLQRLNARTRATFSLARSSASACVTASNPLLLIGVGALIPPGDCDAIVAEAQGTGEWAPWDGDLGDGSTAKSLESLPESRALWEGNVGNAVRARIAGVYGVPQSGVVAHTGDVFVCRVTDEGYGEVGVEEPEEFADVAQQQEFLSVSAEFRRSKSLVTFAVVLSAQDTRTRRWSVCMEQLGQCIRPTEQGAGAIFSGKLRHATVALQRPGASLAVQHGDIQEDAASRSSPALVLRGFASILHPRVREDTARWQWGSPAWHVDAPWVKDEDILNRVWSVEGESDDTMADAAGSVLPASTPEANAPGTVSEGTTFNRMNSSAAHRYYRQGLGGMGVPVVDDQGRPAIDLVEDKPLWRMPGSREKTTEVTVSAVLRRRYAWDRRRKRVVVGKAGLSTEAGTSPRMDAALRELFGASEHAPGAAAAAAGPLVRVPVPPIKYVFVDPRYRGLGLGRRLFLEAMCSLARRGFRFALIVVEDNGSGGLFGFYEDMGFVRAEELLGLPRAMIAPIPPPESVVNNARVGRM